MGSEMCIRDRYYCAVVNGKYYDDKGNSVSKSEYEAACNPAPRKYKYLYKKTVHIHQDKEYSNWTDWSDDIEYNPDNNNINWGKHEFSWYEKNGSKTFEELCNKIKIACENNNQNLISAYWDEPDYTIHHNGTSSKTTKDVVKNINKTIEKLSKELKDTLIIISADHGAVDVKEVYLNEVKEQVEINAKYDGYIKKAYKEVEKLSRLEEKQIPEDIDYKKVTNLASEARQKLEKIRPLSLIHISEPTRP